VGAVDFYRRHVAVVAIVAVIVSIHTDGSSLATVNTSCAVAFFSDCRRGAVYGPFVRSFVRRQRLQFVGRCPSARSCHTVGVWIRSVYRSKFNDSPITRTCTHCIVTQLISPLPMSRVVSSLIARLIDRSLARRLIGVTLSCACHSFWPLRGVCPWAVAVCRAVPFAVRRFAQFSRILCASIHSIDCHEIVASRSKRADSACHFRFIHSTARRRRSKSPPPSCHRCVLSSKGATLPRQRPHRPS